MESERLQKAIARSGLCSRRAAEDLIARGKVTVNGVRATLGDKVDVTTDRVEVRGVPLPVAPGLVHYLLNKPVGVVSTTADTHGRPTVVDLVPDDPPVHPVGRLDLDSGGLLILTNDGDLTLRLTHPRHGVEKVYAARVHGRVSDSAARHLERGVDLDDGPARALRARVLDRRDDVSLLEITMGEGRNREVRRMCSVIGHDVETLFRTRIGPITDASLGEGEWRPLTLAEVRSLFDAAGSVEPGDTIG